MQNMTQTDGNTATVSDVVRLEILGDFCLYTGQKELTSLTGRASKIRSILCYLILHRDRAVSRGELIDIFYEDENQSDPGAALKMNIMRIRQLLAPLFGDGVVPIIGRRGTYQWNPAVSCRVDAEELEQFCLEAELPERSAEERCELYQRIMELYSGDLILEKDDLLWSSVLSARCHNRYISAAEHYAQLLLERNLDAQAEEVCMRAIQFEATNETLYVALIRALLRQHRQQEARTFYNTISDTLYQMLGVRPSAELQQLNNRMAEGEMPEESDLERVMNGMQEPQLERSAFFCSFEQFRSIYQLEVRRAPRNGSCLHVAMFTVGENCCDDTVMEQVQQSIVRNLRQSDVVARYSNSQFIVMMPDANLEDSDRVAKRVTRAYRKSHPKTAVPLCWQIRELETGDPVKAL